MDQRPLEITICSKCEVREYFQRELISSIQIFNASDIRIVRNAKCQLFYLVSCPNEIFILSSSQGKMGVYKHIPHVKSFTMEDCSCTGKETLKIIQEHDAIPLIFDDNFNIIEHQFAMTKPGTDTEHMLSLNCKLNTKLTEAMFITKCNEKTLDEYIKIRQLASFSLYQKACNQGYSDINLSLERVSSALKVETKDPIVKLCNKKILVILKICNKNPESLENVVVLLQGTNLPSIDYTTILLKETSDAPHLKKIDSQIDSNSEVIVIAVVDLDELKYNVSSRLDFDVVVSYKRNDEIYLLPFKSVSISAMDTMGTDFDILACNEDYKSIVLAVIATSQKFDLKLRHVKSNNEASVDPSNIFLNYLKMRSISNIENVALHNESPFHILHGVMVVYNTSIIQDHTIDIQVYTRQPSQVLALIHYMYQKVPHRIIVTTSRLQLKPIVDEYNLNDFKEETDAIRYDYQDYAISIVKQIEIIQKYLHECLENMKENGDQTQNKVDITAQGLHEYNKFREELLKILQSQKNIKQVKENELQVPMSE
ncbi:hypothetical protein KGM_207499 [Danaus plexippus plexippus]|uniref:Uncharacterized protein n=1 Tax=Danaus plexippus plexippus TaxID=278856 RepID=A0A212EUP0_DANPL|nr:hypothetical protein KGM_207499 [Danaus plexippus plexippus]